MHSFHSTETPPKIAKLTTLTACRYKEMVQHAREHQKEKDHTEGGVEGGSENQQEAEEVEGGGGGGGDCTQTEQQEAEEVEGGGGGGGETLPPPLRDELREALKEVLPDMFNHYAAEVLKQIHIKESKVEDLLKLVNDREQECKRAMAELKQSHAELAKREEEREVLLAENLSLKQELAEAQDKESAQDKELELQRVVKEKDRGKGEGKGKKRLKRRRLEEEEEEDKEEKVLCNSRVADTQFYITLIYYWS